MYTRLFHTIAFKSPSVADSYVFDGLNILWATLNLICYKSHPVDRWRLLQWSSSGMATAKVTEIPPFFLFDVYGK